MDDKAVPRKRPQKNFPRDTRDAQKFTYSLSRPAQTYLDHDLASKVHLMW
jgi:hypothetical protein